MSAFLSGCGGGAYDRPQAVADAAKRLPEKIDYNWDVRPILSQNCFRCHGNDAAKRKAGLRLDIAKNAYGKIPEDKAKRAIVPGNPGKSELMVRITATDADVRMPPKEMHKTLSATEIAILEKWIKDGAKYKQHWAYIAPKEVRPKGTPWDRRAVNRIDNYIFAQVKAQGLAPSPEADKETLINRVSLDLTGLPPTLQEVDAFVADKDPKAYEHLVDRLLASPAYGERMATTWMDVARYSETDGYLDDHHDRLFAPWRDWVISAFNRNMPYDKFATWQLAGDLMPHASREQILATAFGRLGKRSTENGLIDEEYRVEYRNERSELVGKAFLGLTVGCAKCHDHKYDVISHKEYYSLAGFFNSIDERGLYAPGFVNRADGPTLDWPTAKQAADLQTTNKAVADQEAKFRMTWAAVGSEAAHKVGPLLASPDKLVKGVQSALDSATVAYYPLDEVHPGPIDQFKVLRKPPVRPANLVRPRTRVAQAPAAPATKSDPNGKVLAARTGRNPDVLTRISTTPRSPAVQPAAAAKPAAGTAGGESAAPAASPPRARAPTLPDGIVAGDILLTASGKPGMRDAGLERPVLVPGVKGKAFLVKNSRGFLPQNVGWYERNDDFALDLWFKPAAGKVYGDATIINHQDHNSVTADSGYTLSLEKNYLRFDVIHASPNNMLSVITNKPVPAGQWTHVAVAYDGSSRASGIKLYLDGVEQPLEVRRDNLSRTILPTLIQGVLGGDFYGVSFGKRFRAEEFTGGAIDEIRIFDRAITPVEARYLHGGGKALVSLGKDAASQIGQLLTATDPRIVSAKLSLKQAREAQNKAITDTPVILVLGDTPKVRPTYRLDHGLYDAPKEEVKPAGLSRVFPWKAAKYGENRLGMTKWLFDKKNPLTSRVFVNRLWASHFGNGIVTTVEDFGTQGANPSHPELLDWLALEFVRSGWDIKHMQKLMVMSATYRQSSNISKANYAADGPNKWLERGPRYRLPAEMIRDNALVASGLMVKRLGGASTYPYTPAGIWAVTLGGYVYPDDVPNDDHHRRSMYSFVKRTAQPPSMMIFDFADRNVSTVGRRISNTPLQALVLLNDPQYLEAYRKLAERVIHAGGSEDQQIRTVFRLATRRYPDAKELAILRGYRDAELAKYASQAAKAETLLKVGVASADPALDPAQVAAMTMVTAVVLNSPDAYSIR